MLTLSIVLSGVVLATQPFTSTTQGFGFTGGLPYRTSDGSRFFIHTHQDFGDGSPNYLRPTSAASSNEPELEWTTYVTQDAFGPTRIGGGSNNESDEFYLSRGVYQPGFASRTPALGVLIWGSGGYDPIGRAFRMRMGSVTTGTLRGDYFIAGPPLQSGIAPDGHGSAGIFFARLTVRRGVSISGEPWSSYALDGPTSPALGTPLHIDGLPVQGLSARSYLVAQPTIADTGIGGSGEPFGPADVYDIWIVRDSPVQLPTAPTTALACVGALITGRRRRR